jgi:hypothetical protein
VVAGYIAEVEAEIDKIMLRLFDPVDELFV